MGQALCCHKHTIFPGDKAGQKHSQLSENGPKFSLLSPTSSLSIRGKVTLDEHQEALVPWSDFFFFHSAAPLVSFLAEAQEAACTSFQVQGYLSPHTLGREGDLPFLSEASPRQTSTLLLLITTCGMIFKCCPVKPCSVLMKRKEMGINK